MKQRNIFQGIPESLEQEIIEDLVSSQEVRIERILSRGHTSPESGWYDQDENEWVLILEGAGTLTFENGNQVELSKGDYIHIPKNTKHKVSWTDPENTTIWLAIFYK